MFLVSALLETRMLKRSGRILDELKLGKELDQTVKVLVKGLFVELQAVQVLDDAIDIGGVVRP